MATEIELKLQLSPKTAKALPNHRLLAKIESSKQQLLNTYFDTPALDQHGEQGHPAEQQQQARRPTLPHTRLVGTTPPRPLLPRLRRPRPRPRHALRRHHRPPPRTPRGTMSDTPTILAPAAWGADLAAAFAAAQAEMPDITKGRTANVGHYVPFS